MVDLASVLVAPSADLREILERSNRTRAGILLVVDGDNALLGVITDGDIRRALMAATALDVTAGELLKARPGNGAPITARPDATHAQLVNIVRRTGISHVPLVDQSGKVQGLVTLQDLLEEDEVALQAVVMAGGRGSRLMPLTEDLPKPMLPVGGRPLMERIINQLSETGIKQVSITTHYQASKIEQHFGDGERFGVKLRYLPEDKMLGTAGGLALLERPENALLVINGDILTQVDFRAMHSFHREQRASLTIAVRAYEFQIPYGVVESNGIRVERVVEKPTHKAYVSAGIYLMNREVHALIPKDQKFDMPDLIRSAISNGLTVVSFPVWEYWRDIGHPNEYQEADLEARSWTGSSGS